MKTIKQIIVDENIKSLIELLEKHPEVWSNKFVCDGNFKERGCIIQLTGYIKTCANPVGNLNKVLNYPGVARWNDSPNRTIQDIIELTRKAGL